MAAAYSGLLAFSIIVTIAQWTGQMSPRLRDATYWLPYIWVPLWTALLVLRVTGR